MNLRIAPLTQPVVGRIVCGAFFLSAFVLPRVAEACSVCFGNPDSPHTQGVQNAVWLLLAVIVSVLVALSTFFIQCIRRSNLVARTSSNPTAYPPSRASSNGKKY